jgi:hypothetical protein
VTALFVRHAFLDRRTKTRHQGVQRLDDAEEHGSSDGDEREQVSASYPASEAPDCSKERLSPLAS